MLVIRSARCVFGTENGGQSCLSLGHQRDSHIKAKLDNIFNSELEYTQGGQTFQSYEKGTKVSVSIDWDF